MIPLLCCERRFEVVAHRRRNLREGCLQTRATSQVQAVVADSGHDAILQKSLSSQVQAQVHALAASASESSALLLAAEVRAQSAEAGLESANSAMENLKATSDESVQLQCNLDEFVLGALAV